jgi:hypothetical protein
MEKQKPPEKKKQAEEAGNESTWSRDIEERDYYYDDSTGYEVYQPEDEDETEEEKNAAG